MNTLINCAKNIPWKLAGIYTAAVLAAIIIFLGLLLVLLIFFNTTCRNPFKKRTRECTRKNDAIQMRMFTEGVAWVKEFKDKIDELHIVNDGLNLYGEYINLGFDKCCILLQGRAESLLYCYYYADVYAKNGYNILVIDVRSHGLSDGKFQTGGIKESEDLIKWIKHINEKYKIEDFTVHGVCLGGATAIFAYAKLKKEGCNFIKRIITDGLYKTYLELYKAHTKVYKVYFIYPLLYAVLFLIFITAKVRHFKETPIKYMKDIDIPILFIWSTMDKHCPKSNSEELFEACVSKHKEICFFPKGRHSHIRASQVTEYDELIAKFLQKHI